MAKLVEMRRVASSVSRRMCGAIVVGVILLGGCSDILDVTDRDVATPESLQGPEAIKTLVAGAVGDFAVAYQGEGGSGGNVFLGAVLATGILADEYQIGSNDVERLESDSRNFTDRNTDAQFLFHNLHRARVSLASTDRAIAAVDPDDRLRAVMHGLSGYVFDVFGEVFCSGVPMSDLVDGQPVYYEPMTTTELFDTALVEFDLALGIAIAAGSTREEYLARIGKGRALLSLGRTQEAADVVAPVPTSFEWLIELNGLTGRQSNEIWTLTASNERFIVSNREGGNGLPYREVNDPRVPWQLTPGNTAFDGATPMYTQLRYPSPTTPVPLARGIEARLIEAEAALLQGDRNRFFAIHNALRAPLGLEALADTNQNQDALLDLHFAERAYWLFSSGHRLGDLRRLVRVYGRASNTVFPSGAYFKGGSFGTHVNYPVPFVEQNNPNFSGCLNRDA